MWFCGYGCGGGGGGGSGGVGGGAVFLLIGSADSVRDGNDNKRGVNCCFYKFKRFCPIFAELD